MKTFYGSFENPVLQTFGPDCPGDATVLDLTSSDIELILDLHNDFRSQIAMGQIANFSSADRMPTVKWNNELAYLAELHVKKCSMAHTACQNTDRFFFCGQNVGALSNNVRFVDIQTGKNPKELDFRSSSDEINDLRSSYQSSCNDLVQRALAV